MIGYKFSDNTRQWISPPGTRTTHTQ